MRQNLIFIIITIIYVSIMYYCYIDFDVISLINMLFMTMMYIAFIIASIIVSSDKENQNKI